jgi:anaerobic magnesium-protoporphyrin IX monomethyl ester cyclase
MEQEPIWGFSDFRHVIFESGKYVKAMDILLVNPNHGNPNNIPWGVLAVGSYLRSIKGLDVGFVDASVHGEEKAMEAIKRRLPAVSIIGFACMSMDIPFVKAAADMLKSEKPSCKTIIGGPHAVLCPDQTARYANFDFVSYGVGEETTFRLLEELKAPAPQLDKVPGLLYRENGEVRRTPPAPTPDHFDMDYAILDSRVRESFPDYIQIFSGRGCSFRCSFCYNSVCGQLWQGRPMDDVVAELDAMVREYDPKVVYFRDENFFQDHGRVREFVRLYREKGFTFKWRATCRANYFNDRYLDEGMVKELADVGCSCLKFGFESGSKKILKKLKKGIQVKHMRKVVNTLAKEPRIKPYISFMIGLPGETYEDVRDTLNISGWITRMIPNVSLIGPQYFRMYPGGELYDSILKEYGFEAPRSIEEWDERYQLPQNRNGLCDEGIHYPWVPKFRRFLALNTDLLLHLASKDIFRGMPLRKRAMLWPFRLLARLRFQMGWYRGLIDLRLAKVIYQSQFGKFLSETQLYSRIRSTEWYGTMRKTRSFNLLRWALTGHSGLKQKGTD